MEEQMVNIMKNLKVTQDRKTSYADKSRKYREFKVGEHVFLKVKAKRISLDIGKFPKVGSKKLWAI
jgi:hypothetical protein